ncbi:MAG: hypothetical protein J6Y91_05140 [Alphaproteobacteria bacterium]|nr:hypothetical protein [Alphaproteobacteria bacterium]
MIQKLSCILTAIAVALYGHPACADALPANPWARNNPSAAALPTSDPAPQPLAKPETVQMDNGLAANPWLVDRTQADNAPAAPQMQELDTYYEQPATAEIPNSYRPARRIERGGVANIQRPRPVAEQDSSSIWDEWFGDGNSKPAASAPASDSGSMLDSLFGDSSAPAPSSSSPIDDLSQQYDNYVGGITAKYNKLKRETTRSVDNLMNSAEGIRKSAEQMLK